MDLLETLNPAQRAAVSAPPGPLLVVAGPGSGKTRVLTHRIAYLISEMHVAPRNIMAVTFTNKAAREMEHRIDQLLGERPHGLMMGTFHSICVRLLRQEVENMTQYARNFVIFDTDDQLQVVKQALADLNLDPKKFAPGKMLNGISDAKNKLITAEEYNATNYISEVIRRVYAQYQAILQANNAMDFDDLLMNTVQLFNEQPEVLKKYQQRYHHILVDEFQDTNTTQYQLLRQLAGDHNSLFAVGDSDQSIYKWRGADYRNVENLRNDYPQTQMIKLEQNYRSTQLILDAALEVVRVNHDHIAKKLFTNRKGGARIVVREAYNEEDEASWIIHTIEDLLLQGHSANDFAIMYRTNAQSRALEEAFIRRGMPYRLVGATQFYKRREIKDLIAYLRLVQNPADEISLGRVINVPTRGIGKQTQQQLYLWADGLGMQPAEALIRLATDMDVQHPFSGRAYQALYQFGGLLRDWIQLSQQSSVADLLDAILDQIGYRVYLDDGTEEGQDRWTNVMEFRNVAGIGGQTDLSEFLQQVALVAETDNLDTEAKAPTLLTLHAAKGLEFPVVFITGLEEGVLPHSRSLETADEVAEERRLFYVGLTRAKDMVFLSHAFRRTTWGDSSPGMPSRFLSNLPEHLIEDHSGGMRNRRGIDRMSDWDSSGRSHSRSTAPKPANRDAMRKYITMDEYEEEQKQLPESYGDDKAKQQANARAERPRAAAPTFKTGQLVRHAKFGEGTVIESKVTGSDEEVSVAFSGLGVKRLAASMAKLEIIG